MNYFLSRRRIKDILASKTMLVFTVLTAVIILLMIAGLHSVVNSAFWRSLWAPCG
jgi:hypothetical protein